MDRQCVCSPPPHNESIRGDHISLYGLLNGENDLACVHSSLQKRVFERKMREAKETERERGREEEGEGEEDRRTEREIKRGEGGEKDLGGGGRETWVMTMLSSSICCTSSDPFSTCVPAGCRVQGSGCRVQGSGFRVQGAGFRVQGSGCRVQGSGFKVQHLLDAVRPLQHVRPCWCRPGPGTFLTETARETERQRDRGAERQRHKKQRHRDTETQTPSARASLRANAFTRQPFWIPIRSW